MKKKRIIAVIVCVVIFLCYIPTTASAEGQQENKKEEETKEIQDGKETDPVLTTRAGTLEQEELDGDYAHVSNFTVASVIDGTAPFDADSAAGNDQNGSNKTVRTFDTIVYNFEYRTEMNENSDILYVKQGNLYFEFVLPYSSQEAVFDTSSMGWMTSYEQKTENRVIEGETVECQILSGYRTLLPGTEDGNAIPGTGTISAVVQVRAMKNNDQVNPQFSIWLEHQSLAHAVAVPESVTVSALPKYNVQIKEADRNYTKKSGSFDFTTGNADAPDGNAGIVSGRINTYGITIQLYNDTADKGMKGIELPEGDITFDLVLENVFRPDGNPSRDTDVTESYSPLLWSYGANSSAEIGEEGRSQTVLGNTAFAYKAAPFNNYSSINSDQYCNDGGSWSAEKEGNIIHVTVSDYVIDVDRFPTKDASGTTDEYGASVGCISAGEFHIVVPFSNIQTGENVLTEFGAGSSSSFFLTLSDRNLKAVSSSGNSIPEDPDGAENQMEQEDDSVQTQIMLQQEGQIAGAVLWSTRERVGLYDTYNRGNVDGSFLRNGLDWVVGGDELAISWGLANKERGDTINRMMAGKTLMKFDPEAVNLTGEIRDRAASNENAGYETYVYFATKADGTAWESDQEMLDARIEDMRYYESLDEIPEGHVCVGALMEVYPINNDPNIITEYDGGSYPFASVYAVATDDEESMGKVYMVNSTSVLWRWEDYEKYNREIPSMLENDPSDPIQLPEPTATYHPEFYNKTQYTENGYTDGHTNAYIDGDSLYIIGEKATVSKSVMQHASDGSTKVIYDLDYGQRTVDYVLNVAVDGPENAAGDTGMAGNSTRAVIRDVLPEGLNYISGSAYRGGTYQENENQGRPGTVSGGQQFEPSYINENPDGSTELVWIIENLPVGEEMEPIYFSASIGTPGIEGTDVENNASLVNTVSIQSTGDLRDKTVFNENYSSYGISISKLNAVALYKIADTVLNEIREPFSYTLNVGNNGASATEEQVMLDVLPYDGDEKGSSFSGPLSVNSWKIDTGAASNWSTWEVYYTEDAGVKGTISSDYDIEDIKNLTSEVNGQVITWTKATINGQGEITELQDKSPSAVAVVGSIETGEAYRAKVELLAEEAEAGSRFVNSLSRGEDEVEASAYIISRTLEGTAWEDSDRNGARDPDERLLSGITVALYKLDPGTGDYEPVVDPSGQPVTTVTDSSGNYVFEELAVGTYSVRFGADDQLKIYRATVSDPEEVSDYMDSDAVPVYDTAGSGCLKYTEIDGIVMPEKEQLNTYLYVSRYNDSGFHKGNITVTKTVEGNLGDETRDFHFQITLDNPYTGIEEASYTRGTAADPDQYTGTLSFEDGTAQFELKHGEIITISQIPYQSTYEVTETDGTSEGYTVSADNADGLLTDDINIDFLNLKNAAVDSGVDMTGLPGILAAIAGVTGLTGYIYQSRRLKRAKHKQ